MSTPPVPPISADALALVDAEEALLTRVHEALIDASRRVDPATGLREQLEAARSAANTLSDDLPALLGQLHVLQDQAHAMRRAVLPDPAAPYFAHLRVRSQGRVRDVLLGHCTFLSPAHRVHMLDWQTAPLARVFFQHEEGDEYEEQVNGITLEGVLELRRLLTFDRGRLVRITAPAVSLVRDSSGGWHELGPGGAHSDGALPGPRVFGTGATRVPAPPVSALLDAAQFAAIELDDRRPLLLLGSAGSGKSTVAMHRLASLHHHRPEFYLPEEMAVVTPEGGLARLLEALLRDLRISDVPVRTYDRWIEAEAPKVLEGLPVRIRHDAPAAVIRFKRHPAMRASLEALVSGLEHELAARIDRGMIAGGRIATRFLACPGPTPRDRLHQLRDLMLPSLAEAERAAFTHRLEREEAHLFRVGVDRFRLFGDTALLQHAVDASDGSLTQAMLREVVARTARQLDPRAERAYAHVDPDRLETLDGLEIDHGTPDEVAESIDVEDLPLLLELLRLKTGAIEGRHGTLTSCRHLVIDEAQELTPIELGALSAALEPGGSLTVAGDEAQQIDPTAEFASWELILAALRAEDATTICLENAYRSTRPIMDFAQAVLGPAAPARPRRVARDGTPVLMDAFPDEGHRAAALIGALERLTRLEPSARVAVIAHSLEEAGLLERALSHHLRVRLVTDGDFVFRPGIDVTDVAQIKGLEFDYVILPDVGAGQYPDLPAARRMLHVAATRAIHQLWVMCVGTWSPILGRLPPN